MRNRDETRVETKKKGVLRREGRVESSVENRIECERRGWGERLENRAEGRNLRVRDL